MVELLVALVISSVLAGVIFQLILGQGKFSRLQTARQEVQQNSRAALDIITSELRGAAVGGVTATTATSIRFRVPRTWGLVCSYRSASGVNGVTVIFPDTTGFRAVDQADSLAAPLLSAAYQVYDLTFTGIDLTVPPLGMAQTDCNAPNGSPANGQTPRPLLSASTRAASRARLLGGTGLTAALDPGPQNSPIAVYLFDSVEYSVGSATGLEGQWILRKVNGEPTRPLAGPIGGSGLRLTFWDANGTSLNPAGGATPAAVARVGLVVVTSSQGRINTVAQTDSSYTEVSLRNRPA